MNGITKASVVSNIVEMMKLALFARKEIAMKFKLLVVKPGSLVPYM